jgi:hypothetical protein
VLSGSAPQKEKALDTRSDFRGDQAGDNDYQQENDNIEGAEEAEKNEDQQVVGDRERQIDG